LYFIHKFKFDEEWFPSYIPDKKLRAELNITVKPKAQEIFVMYAEWYIEIVKKRN
jgi:hypothetical protein